MKLYFLTVLILFVSCNRTQQNNDPDILAAMNLENYDYFARSTNYSGIPSSYEKGLIKLKQLADKAISDSNSRVGDKSFKEFSEQVQYIMEEYNGIRDFPVKSLEKNSSRNFLIRTLEHVAINSVIRSHLSLFFTFDHFKIMVVPEEQIVRAGEIYKAQIYVACDDHYNPVKLLVENDTIMGSPNEAGLVYSIRTHQAGKFSQKAELIFKSWGEEEVYPFEISYEVH